MERMTLEQAVSRQQIVMIQDWDAYQASLLGRKGCKKSWRTLTPKPGSLGKQAAWDDGRKRG